MSYTFWHAGLLIGEADMEQAPGEPRQRGGIFRPTAYGLQIFPRLSGMLTAAHGLHAHLSALGVSPDDVPPDAVAELLDTTPAGRKILDIGRTLVDVEMRAPDGRRLELASIAFSDLREIQRLARALAVDEADALAELPPEAPRYVVTATLRADAPARGGWAAGTLERWRRARDN